VYEVSKLSRKRTATCIKNINKPPKRAKKPGKISDVKKLKRTEIAVGI